MTKKNNGWRRAKSGLYDPAFEHDSCGVGFIANLDGRKERAIVAGGLNILLNLEHRGAVGSDPRTGDGAGILMQLPHEFLARAAHEAKIDLPAPGAYAAGVVFLPFAEKARRECIGIFEKTVRAEGLEMLGWRDTPVDPSCIGASARKTMPFIRHVFIKNTGLSADGFERKVYVVRNAVQNAIDRSRIEDAYMFYVTSLSSKTMVYKGLLLADQVPVFFPDLQAPDMRTALAVVHQRYSTNTLPTWDLAQPFRYLAHNGEINTLRGNILRVSALERVISSPVFGDDIKKLPPIARPAGSDSAMFDNVAELLYQAGRSLPHVMMMLIPEPFGVRYHMGPDRRSFYEYHAALMEPWDGPAAMSFTDGELVGAILDRNGLRPASYTVTKSGLVVLASEAGVLDIPPSEVRAKGRLQPGRMFLVDTVQGRIVDDVEIKSQIVRSKPYRRWIVENQLKLKGLFETAAPVTPDRETLIERQAAFGYTDENARIILRSMVTEGKEPTGSMGNDTPLAVLSDKPQLLFAYFKQLFAQVTNPPIDPIREELVMSLMNFVGRDANLLEEGPEHCRLLKLKCPILSNDDMERIRKADQPDLRTGVASTLFRVDGADGGLRGGLARLLDEAVRLVTDEDKTLLVISDRGVDREHTSIPILLAVSAVHHHLSRKGLRARCGIIVETGEARQVMHFALLVGYGASAVNPYLAYETIAELVSAGEFAPDLDAVLATENYITAIHKGLFKILSKMGIATLRSYRAAQIFEAVGIARSVIDEYFTGTPSRIGGIDMEIIEQETLRRHRAAYTPKIAGTRRLPHGGQFSWRRDGERHLWTPDTISTLQRACREGRYDMYLKYAGMINGRAAGLYTLRGLLRFKPGTPVPLDEVEPVESIVRRFACGAMSHGSISREAHESIAVAMNRLGGMSNSGEGGEDPARFRPDENGDSRSSFVKQVASGRFGVTTEYLVNAREIQIKIAQGAKPGEGGQLPGHKVNREIARLRFATPGVTLISPPPHHDIYSIEDLAQLIFDLKNVNPEARIGVKLVSEIGVGTVAAGVSKGKADMVLISGHDGGTGASPLSSIYHAGLPWEIGLAEAQQVLVENDLRDRIRVQVDGQIRTGRDVVIAALLGAEEYGFATVALVTQGCVMMRKCHKNTCPVGVATQDPELRRNFTGRPEYLMNYLLFVAREARELMAELGFRTIDEMVGRVDRIEKDESINHWKAKHVDLSAILKNPAPVDAHAVRCTTVQGLDLGKQLDRELIDACGAAIANFEKIRLERPIRNVNRTVGTMLSGVIAKKYGLKGLPDDTIHLKFSGSAGQSFGAFLVNGICIELEGEANDYLGKGMCGGRIAVYPPAEADFAAEKNTIAGNTLLYGATGGEVFLNGRAGERFAVRNSGARAVVEGIGNHGCEYMTGGVVVVLGRTGLNFGAGMSGGCAYVLDDDQLFDSRLNLEMVDLEPVRAPDDVGELRTLIERHVAYTRSALGRRVLDNWDGVLPRFVKVMPTEYRRALMELGREREEIDKEFKPFRGQKPRGVDHE